MKTTLNDKARGARLMALKVLTERNENDNESGMNNPTFTAIFQSSRKLRAMRPLRSRQTAAQAAAA